MNIDTAELLKPVSTEQPGGEDVGFDDVNDRIREARRADDPTLSQGEWQTELKTSDWRTVVNLCEEILARRSKDLQIATWLGEASIARDGLAGAAPAFDLLGGLLEQYWEQMFPRMEDGDPEERAAKLAWFNSNAAERLRRVPLSEGNPVLTLIDWQVSREVENLARQNAEAYQAALTEGKPNAEAFDKAIDGGSDAFVRGLLEQVDAARAAFARMSGQVDMRLGRAAPSLSMVDDTLKQLRRVIARTASAKGLIGESVEADETTTTTPGTPAATGSGVSASSKQAALQSLRDIAAFFKRTEPHSPVSFLLDKAVAWADMPLDLWLAEVVRDDAVLKTVRDRIGAS